MKKYLMVAMATLLLSGCKVDIKTSVNSDDLLVTDHKTVMADLNFEVASCSSSEDSRQESDELIKIKAKVPSIFHDAQYVECYRKSFDSFAHFKVPVSVGVRQKNAPFKDDLYLFSDGNIVAGIGAKRELISRIKTAEADMPDKLNFNITVDVKKGSQPLPPAVTLLGVYVQKDTPALVANVDFSKYDDLAFRLSDVSVDALMKYGTVPFLVKPEFFDGLKEQNKK